MKRWTKRIAIVAAVLAAIWFGFGRHFVMRVKQNNASVAMLDTTKRIDQHIQEKGTWPTSWESLYPDGVPEDRLWVIRYVVVNWQPPLDEVSAIFERVDMKKHHPGIPPEIDLPLLVRYSDQVPSVESLDHELPYWNWLMMYSIYENLQPKPHGLKPVGMGES